MRLLSARVMRVRNPRLGSPFRRDKSQRGHHQQTNEIINYVFFVYFLLADVNIMNCLQGTTHGDQIRKLFV